MTQTSSVYDHFIIQPSSVTLTFNLPKYMFQMAQLLLKENMRITLKSMHKCRSYGPDKLIYVPSSVTLTFNLLEQMFQMALLLPKDNNCQ